MKTTKIIASVQAISVTAVVLAGCASADGPWRTLRKPVAAAPPSCADFQVSVYFEQDSAALVPEARMVLAGARDQARGCAVKSVRVVGLADAVGASEANLILSRRRAEAVSAALAKHGFAQVDIDRVAVGDAGAVAPSGAAAPLRRRADILFDLAAK
ncbi:OmpA family protein [uncultured Caulobacter sp.]|uniref:OmpA family protein n=1 Tax=uncultured Caulobacter sp. TaxID=158749 RepID=UPI002624D55E|nr:OmpA family protein [uncultured Caulobacter sp.]